MSYMPSYIQVVVGLSARMLKFDVRHIYYSDNIYFKSIIASRPFHICSEKAVFEAVESQSRVQNNLVILSFLEKRCF